MELKALPLFETGSSLELIAILLPPSPERGDCRHAQLKSVSVGIPVIYHNPPVLQHLL